MTRIKSLSHGVTQIASPYESIHIKTSPYHRTHRSGKNKRPNKNYLSAKKSEYKRKLEELKVNELENEKRQIINNQTGNSPRS